MRSGGAIVSGAVLGRDSGRPVVLFVDGDAAGRLPLEICLGDAGFDVLVALTEVDLLAALGQRSVDLLVADAEMVGAFGPAVVKRLQAEQERLRIPLLLLATRGTMADRTRGLDLPVDDLLVRPVWSRELVARARLLLQRQMQAELSSVEAPMRPRVDGSLSDIAVSDLLRSVELNRRSGTIHLRSADGVAGSIYFRDGRAVDAQLGNATGRDAIYRLLTVREGDFAITWGSVDRPDVVGMPPRALVVDGLRRVGNQLPDVPVAIAREPGVERRGAVLAGTIQDNRATGSTMVGWAPALAPPVAAKPPARRLRPRRLKLVILAAAAGAALATVLAMSRPPPSPARPSAALVVPRPVVTPLVSAAMARRHDEASDPLRSPGRACQDVSALGKPARTVEVCTTAFQVLPDSATIAAIVAHAELEQGHFELAGEWARKALDIDPTVAEPYAYLGFVADQAGRRREARASYRRYLELAPRGPYAQDISALLARNP
jgi:DNA-binding response OmpR family regulator